MSEDEFKCKVAWASLDNFADAMSSHYRADFGRCAQRFAELIVRYLAPCAHDGVIIVEADYEFFVAIIPIGLVVSLPIADQSGTNPKRNI